jgi:hypothetical protein
VKVALKARADGSAASAYTIQIQSIELTTFNYTQMKVIAVYFTLTISYPPNNAMGCVTLHIHQISVLDDFGTVIQGMISHLLKPLTVEGNDFLHFNLHRLIVMSLVIEQSIECDFLHGHRHPFFLIV